MSLPRLYYILIGREVRAVPDILEWATWLETHGRRVAETHIGEYWVSTVFIGIDHNHSGVGPPVLFESMVFGPETGETIKLADGSGYVVRESLHYQLRYCTYDDAERGHEGLCQEIRRLTESAERVTAQILSRVKFSKQ